MLSDAELARQRARNGMTGDDDAHKRMVSAIEAAARKCGLQDKHAVAAVVGAVMADKLINVEADGSIAWTGEDGWSLESALPGYLNRPEHAWIRQRDRELAGQSPAQGATGKPTRAAIGEALLAQFRPQQPAEPLSRKAIGQALMAAYEGDQ